MRITIGHLNDKVAYINRALGFDAPKWNTVGAIKLYRAYGSTGVHRTMNTSGGITELMGLATMRDVDNFLAGIIVMLRIGSE